MEKRMGFPFFLKAKIKAKQLNLHMPGLFFFLLLCWFLIAQHNRCRKNLFIFINDLTMMGNEITYRLYYLIIM